MRYKTYKRKNLATGVVTTVHFSESHYTEVGLFPALVGGMAQLEAHQLINKWNSSRSRPKFIYSL